MQSKSRDVAHEGSTMRIDYNTRFLLAVRRKRKIIGYFIGHSEATAQDDSICRSITLPLHRKNSGFKKSVIQKRTQEHRNSIVWLNHLQ